MSEQLYIYTSISADDAVRAGSATAGEIRIPLDESSVTAVRELWEEAKPYVHGEKRPVGNRWVLEVSSPGIGGALDALREHAQQRAEIKRAIEASSLRLAEEALQVLNGPDVEKSIRVVLYESGQIKPSDWDAGVASTHITVALRPWTSTAGSHDHEHIKLAQWMMDAGMSVYVPHGKSAVEASERNKGENERRMADAIAASEPILREIAARHEAEARAKEDQRAADLETIKATLQLAPGHIRERYEAGRLLESELKTALANIVFANLDLPRYEKINDGELEHSESCCDPEVRVKSSDYTGPLDAEEWESWKAAKTAIEAAGFDAELRQVKCYCTDDDCDAEVLRLQARAKAVVGDIDVIRAYAV